MPPRFSLSSLASRARQATQALTHQMQGKQQVGRDFNGNTYFVQRDAPTETAKRWVEYPPEDPMGEDQSRVPMAWSEWGAEQRAR